MKRVALIILIFAAAIKLISLNPSHAQEKVDSVVGVVAAIDVAKRTIMIKTDAGAAVSLQADDNTVCFRLPAGERTLSKATSAKFEEIAIYDRILAHGGKNDQVFLAQRLIVMPAAEVSKKREHDLDEWKRRGIGGIVREVNAASGEI